MGRKSAKGAADKAEMAKWLFENSRDLMQVVSPAGVLLQVNRAWTEFTGLSEQELIGRSVFDFCHPDEVAGIRSRAASTKPGDVSEAEVRLRDRDGNWRWVAARRQVMDDGAHIGNMRDISTARAHMQEVEAARDSARRSETQIRQLVEAAPFAVAMMDHEMRYVVVSPRWAQAFGLDLETDYGEFPRVPRRFLRAHAEVMEGFTVSRREDQFTDRQGRRHWLRWEGAPWYDAQGKVGGMVVYADDISALSEARRDAQENASRLNLALEAAEAGVYEIDHVKESFWCSPEFERITGQKNSNYREATELRYPGFHPDDLSHVRASFRALHRGDKKSGESFEARIVRPDGTARWVRVFHHLLVNKNGRWLKAVGLVQDCDTLKRQELALIEAQRAAEAGAEAKAAFLANMSHEIRTPMNGVMGVLHLLASEDLSADGRAMLAEALSCGQMLAELLNDVIDFSKIEAGRLELASEPVDPCALVRGVARLLEPQARAKGLDLVVRTECGMGWVRSDPVRLRQALFNLVGNAVKFTEAGQVLVRCCRGEGGALRFEVEDTGVGIAAAAQSRLFERFNQGDASTTRKFGGSGLGLAITRRLAEMMQGQVGFTSIEGQGSTFWFEVAVEPAEAQPAASESGAGMLEGVRVLVVEDNATNRMIATKLLENLGGSVETAADGHLGVEAAARGNFDLILMDIQMPGIDGVEAARRIRALGGGPAATPIVALTANVLSHQRQAYLDAGMDGVVGKPIAPALLLAEIAAAAANRESALAASAAA
jgi:PAS domain S-box-containing protein